MGQPDLEPVWGLVANVVDERFYGPDGEVKTGTKHFVPGAKLYYHYGRWGMGGEQIMVTGHHRGSKKLVSVVMARMHLHNWRAKLIYKPAVLKRFALNGNEVERRARDSNPEEAAKKLAAHFNNTLHFSTYDRPKELVDQLIEHWTKEGFDGLDGFTDFDADRWIVLYERLTAVGIGVSNFSRQYEWWIKPGYEAGWQGKLKNTLEWSIPDGEGRPKLEYETGKSATALRQLSELMSERFDDLHAATFEAGSTQPGADRDHLTRFVSPLLQSALVQWPPTLAGRGDELLAAWLGGLPEEEVADRLDLTEEEVAAGFEILRTDCYQLADAAFRLMKSEKDYDADEKNTISEVLGRKRLQLGVNSALAYSLVLSIFHQHYGAVKFGRVVASALASEFQNQEETIDLERFRPFALGRVEGWVERGLVQPIDPTDDQGNWGTLPSRTGKPIVAYRLNRLPEETPR